MDSWSAAEAKSAGDRPEGPRPYSAFVPSRANGWKFAPSAQSGFEDWPALDDLFPKWFQGVNPNRGLDGSVIDTDRSVLESRMCDYFSELSFGELQKRHPVLCEERARYEPEAKFLNEARPDLGAHLVEGNEFLVGAPQPRRVSESRPLILRSLFDPHLHDWGSVGFPAEVNPAEHESDLFKPEPEDLVPRANVAGGAWNALRAAWDLKGDLRGKNAKALCRALFRYCAAIAHSPQYEADHKDSLLQGWPRVPIAKNKADFDEVTTLGERLAILLDPL